MKKLLIKIAIKLLKKTIIPMVIEKLKEKAKDTETKLDDKGVVILESTIKEVFAELG